MVIEVKDVHKTYSEGWFRRRRVAALQGVSLTVESGEIFGLLGPNGAGKTTLIKILLGIVRKSRGLASVLGQPAGRRGIRREVGYLPESHRIPQHLTGFTALDYYGGLSGLSASDVRLRRDRALEMVGLGRWGRSPVRSYSKGMQQRLGLAQAMLHRPRLIILDEPTDGVDPVGRAEIREVLRQLRSEGVTIFLNSHLLQETELICDRVAIMDKGRVVCVEAVEQLLRNAEQSGFELRCEVRGDLDRIETAMRGAVPEMDGFEIRPIEASDLQRITVKDASQSLTNEIIDALRSLDVDVFSIGRRDQTLEEVFLNLVNERTMS